MSKRYGGKMIVNNLNAKTVEFVKGVIFQLSDQIVDQLVYRGELKEGDQLDFEVYVTPKGSN
jgi:hypothetical protein